MLGLGSIYQHMGHHRNFLPVEKLHNLEKQVGLSSYRTGSGKRDCHKIFCQDKMWKEHKTNKSFAI